MSLDLWLIAILGRCYWWPIRSPASDDEKQEMGVNTNNIEPELLRFVDRKYEYSQITVPLRSREAAHPDDQARY